MKRKSNAFARFCFKHRDKGIPNLMLYICIGTGLVYFLSMYMENYTLYSYLLFDREL